MPRFLRILLIVLGVTVGIIVAALATSTIVNQVASANEAKQLPTYGELITVGDHRMNVVVAEPGADVPNPDTIVLIPGFGTAAPALDFAPLIDDLSTQVRVVALEPLGFGLSDPTDAPRTAENIVGEMHDAVSQLQRSLGFSDYALMGHSIGGIYGLEWADRFGDELTAFIGIDSSVPEQANMDTEFPIDLMRAANFLGLPRVLSAFGDGLDGTPYTDEQRDQMRILSLKNSLAPTYLDEMQHIASNFSDKAGATFPQDLPILLFAQAGENPGQPDWIQLHEAQAASVDDGTLILVKGKHYLHHTQAAEIAKDTREFLERVEPRQ